MGVCESVCVCVRNVCKSFLHDDDEVVNVDGFVLGNFLRPISWNRFTFFEVCFFLPVCSTLFRELDGKVAELPEHGQVIFMSIQ